VTMRPSRRAAALACALVAAACSSGSSGEGAAAHRDAGARRQPVPAPAAPRPGPPAIAVTGAPTRMSTGADAGTLPWNGGGGRFREGTAAAGVPAVGWYAGAAVGDVDGDGWPDLFVAGRSYAGDAGPGASLAAACPAGR